MNTPTVTVRPTVTPVPPTSVSQVAPDPSVFVLFENGVPVISKATWPHRFQQYGRRVALYIPAIEGRKSCPGLFVDRVENKAFLLFGTVTPYGVRGSDFWLCLADIEASAMTQLRRMREITVYETDHGRTITRFTARVFKVQSPLQALFERVGNFFARGKRHAS